MSDNYDVLAMQARAWRDVFDLCRSLGMEPNYEKTGVQTVKDFITELVKAKAAQSPSLPPE